METVLKFLRDLDANNNKEWFTTNKARYQEAQEKWNNFCLQLINEVGKYDPTVAGLTLRDCTYRIYRDTRFSNDKTPYKTHFGVFLCKGGKKSMHAGYYFHVGTGTGEGYPHQHMLAAGNYCYDKRTVQMLREDISFEWETFNKEVLGAADKRFFVDMSDALKKVPKDYPADAPYADWMRLKSYCLVQYVDDKFITSPDLAQRVAELFRTTHPFIDFINRAVDFEE